MATPVYEGNTHIYLVPSINDTDAPTTGEVAAGTDITAYVTKDGWAPNPSNNRVDQGNLATTFDAQVMGSHGAQPSLRVLRDEDNTAWDLFPRGTEGYLVVCPFEAAANGVSCEVYPIQTGTREPQATAANERQTFMVPIAVTAEPSYDAEIVTGS